MPRICAFVGLLVCASSVHGEVLIQHFDEPLVERYRSRLEANTKDNEPSDLVWFVPYFEVDASTAAGSSTFFSLRNESDVATNVLVEYFNRAFTQPRQQAQRHVLIPKQIVALNVRDVLGSLAVDADRFARGLIRITPRPDEPISVDVFQIDVRNNFATGSLAVVFPTDFCTFWQVRFLGFAGSSGGSVATVLVNGPRGLSAASPPTLVADVYNQRGTFIRSTEIRTDQWTFELDLLALAGGRAGFGSVELILNAQSLPGGVVAVAHNALGKYSVGVEGVCRDRI